MQIDCINRIFQEATYAYDEVGDEEEGLCEGLQARAHLGWPCYHSLYCYGGAAVLAAVDERYRELLILPSPNTTRR